MEWRQAMLAGQGVAFALFLYNWYKHGAQQGSNDGGDSNVGVKCNDGGDQLALLGLPVALNPERVGVNGSRIDRIFNWMKQPVNDGRIPFAQCMVARKGVVVFHGCVGKMNLERGLEIKMNTISRFYSMTKTVTSVAIMQLHEKGLVELEDNLSKFIPEFANMTVLSQSPVDGSPIVEASKCEITIKHLLTHTAGLTYGIFGDDEVDKLYTQNDVRFFGEGSLEEKVRVLAGLPLMFHPGERWHYSVAIDVLGRVVEVLSGKSLAAYFEDHIFEPLKMKDTAFTVKAEDEGRFAECYEFELDAAGAKSFRVFPGDDNIGTRAGYFQSPEEKVLSGGGGLVSTVPDYLRFAQMLCNKGELDGARLLGKKTVEYMFLNHLPGGQTLVDMGQETFSETSLSGIGFGLGGCVVVDPAQTGVICSKGEYAWGGYANTGFYVDSEEEVVVVWATQCIPSSQYPFRKWLHALVAGSMIQ